MNLQANIPSFRSGYISFCPLTMLLAFSMILMVTGCDKQDTEPTNKNWPEWDIEFMGAPMGDIALNSISIHPEDDQLWFVTSYVRALMITRDGGQSWEQHFDGGDIPVLSINPVNPETIFLGLGTHLYRSHNLGKAWTEIRVFPKAIASILISEIDESVYVGIRWEDSETPNGMFKSKDLGNTWNLYSYNSVEDGLIPWDIAEDPVNGILYVATEIYDHPNPYNPPFLKSADGGETWTDISESLPWHAVSVQVHPETQSVYFLAEGPGLYCSGDFGETWEFLSDDFWLSFLIDPNHPEWFWGGNHNVHNYSGGIYFSANGGEYFKLIGLEGEIINSLCLDANSDALYATAYQSGIYRIREK